eukprot:gene19612-biopygen25997
MPDSQDGSGGGRARDHSRERSGDAVERDGSKDREGSPEVGGPKEHVGVVIKWNEGGASGFLSREGHEDMFLHKSGLPPDADAADVQEGDQMLFQVTGGRNGPCAKVLQRLRRNAPLPGKAQRQPVAVSAV